VSWITKEVIDRDQELVVTAGMDDSHFALNPLVTCNHNYWRPPVGRSLWRKKTKDGPVAGEKAKTHYPPRPATWPAEYEWEPDSAFALVQAGLMAGKSIGFIATKAHAPTADEIKKRPELATVRRVIDEWLLLEYACSWLPANQAAVTEAVGKAVGPGFAQAIGLEIPTPPPAPPEVPAGAAFLTEAELRAAVGAAVAKIDFPGLMTRALADAPDKRRGRV
jgi:hypothetical protein